MQRLSEVIINNDEGWTTEAIREFRTFDGVLRADGRHMLDNGRFQQIVLFFPSEALAEAFIEAGAEALGASSYKIF